MGDHLKDGENINIWLSRQTRPITTDFALILEEKERKEKNAKKKKTVKKTTKKK